MTAPPPVAGIVLAAGASRRAGSAKAMARLEGETLIARSVRTLCAGGCTPVIAVVGAPYGDAVRAAAAAAGATVVHNPDPDRGMLSSMQLGLGAVPGACAAATIALVDHPRVRPETIQALVAAFRAGGAARVRPVHDGRPGHPFVIHRPLFGAIAALPADVAEGARAVLRAAAPVEDVAVDDPAIHDDLDTAEALRAAGIELD